MADDPLLALIEQVGQHTALPILSGQDPLQAAVSGAIQTAEEPAPLRIPMPGPPPILPTSPSRSGILGALAGIQTVLSGRQASKAAERASELRTRLALAPLVGVVESRRTQAALGAARLDESKRHNREAEKNVRERVRILGQALKLDPALREGITVDLDGIKEIESRMSKAGKDPGESFSSAIRTLLAAPSPEAVDMNLSTWLGIVARENPDAAELLQKHADLHKKQLQLKALESPATRAAGRTVSRGTSSRPAGPAPRVPAGRTSPATTGLPGVE